MSHFKNQPIIPAIRHMKDFENLLSRDFTYIVLLESHLTQLPSLLRMAKKFEKKLILHADLIQGLRHDEAAAQFICQMLKPAGLISTHSSVVETTKKNGLIAIQRVFLIDSQSLETSYRILRKAQPDYIELLPGVLPDVVTEVRETTNLPVLAGGFIRKPADVEVVLSAGATAVTTSERTLWRADIGH